MPSPSLGAAASAARIFRIIMLISGALTALILWAAWQRYAHAPYIPHHYPRRQHVAFPGGRLILWLILTCITASLASGAAGRSASRAYTAGIVEGNVRRQSGGEWSERRVQHTTATVLRHRRGNS
jgi:hypothetical protein